MTWWQRLRHRGELEDQLDKELHFHLEQHTADLMAQGYSATEARRLARLAAGGPEQVKEECRDARGTRWVEDLWQDFRYALRTLRQRPGFAAVSVLTLALGIGASTAIFSVVNLILFEPLPYPHPGRILTIWDHQSDASLLETTFGTYRELLQRNHAFEAMAAMKTCQPVMTGAAEPERLDGQCVSASYFRVLGVRPSIGRNFDESDDGPQSPRVAILGNGLWKRRFGGDPAIVGRQIMLDDNPCTVIGVMPGGFDNVLAPSSEIWSTLRYDPSLPEDGREWGHHLRVVGRLRPGMAALQARAELDGIARRPVPEFHRPPWAAMTRGPVVTALQDDITRGIRPVLLAVLGAVLLVLTIACVNVTNVLLARCAQRRGEFAMRAALGAGRTRLVRQLLTESLLIAALGGALGMIVANLGIGALVALSPPGLARIGAVGLDGPVFAFALGVTTLIGLAVGLFPSLQTSRGELHQGMQQSSRRTAGGHQLMRRTLVVAEVALALVLLVCAGLLLRSLQSLFAVPVGFEAAQVITMQVEASSHRYDDGRATHRFFDRALDAVRRVPGVTAAAFTSLLPLSGDQYGEYGVHFESNGGPEGQGNEPAFRYAVTPGYFGTLGIPLRRGRLLDEHDVAGAPPVALISESFARRKFHTGNAIGQRVRAGDTWCTIAGVVGDLKQTSLALSHPDAFYIAPAQWPNYADRTMSLVVRTRGDAAALAPAIKKAVWSVDKDQPIVRVAPMESLLAKSEAERRFALLVFEAFAVVALLLAAIGIYGVLASGVTERLREIGVRAALGASRGDILALVVRQGMTLTALGVAIGLTGAVAATQAIVTMLFGVSRLDPTTYLGVIALLMCVSAIACWIPAWRAARVDPSITLRVE